MEQRCGKRAACSLVPSLRSLRSFQTNATNTHGRSEAINYVIFMDLFLVDGTRDCYHLLQAESCTYKKESFGDTVCSDMSGRPEPVPAIGGSKIVVLHRGPWIQGLWAWYLVRSERGYVDRHRPLLYDSQEYRYFMPGNAAVVGIRGVAQAERSSDCSAATSHKRHWHENPGPGWAARSTEYQTRRTDLDSPCFLLHAPWPW